jgi:cytochrome c oxidase assembly factor CtaG
VPAASAATTWTLDPLQIAPIGLLGFMYFRRAATLARRGAAVPVWRQALFATGLVLMLGALVSPIDALGEEELLTFHMIQHVLLGDLAPLAIVAGLTGPLLRPVLAIRVVDRLRVLGHPLVALPLWAVNLYVWHVPALYEAALGNDAVHALEHACFFTFGALMWASACSRPCSATSSCGRARPSTPPTSTCRSGGSPPRATRPMRAP